jgi:hypothetical protein
LIRASAAGLDVAAVTGFLLQSGANTEGSLAGRFTIGLSSSDLRSPLSPPNEMNNLVSPRDE